MCQAVGGAVPKYLSFFVLQKRGDSERLLFILENFASDQFPELTAPDWTHRFCLVSRPFLCLFQDALRRLPL